MKLIMLTGGWLGFGLGLVGGLVTEGSTWPGTLLRACVGMLGLGLLFRWWGSLCLGCLAEARLEAAQSSETASKDSKPAKTS